LLLLLLRGRLCSGLGGRLCSGLLGSGHGLSFLPRKSAVVPTTQYLVNHLLQESEFLCSLISNLSI
jgi:hypothetical protein